MSQFQIINQFDGESFSSADRFELISICEKKAFFGHYFYFEWCVVLVGVKNS